MTDKLYFGAATAARLNMQPKIFMRTQLVKNPIVLCLLALAWCGANFSATAQIAVGTNGSPVDAFGVIPSAASWSTKSLAGGSADPETDAAMDTFVNGAGNAASTINAQLSNVAGDPPVTLATAQWTSSGYLITRPTGNAVTLMMASLTNVTGGVINSFRVKYEFTQKTTAVANEVVKGHRVYYNLTGATNKWVPLGDFGDSFTTNVVQAIDIEVEISATPWANATVMYLLFADDNSVPNADGANAIDNFKVTNVVAVLSPVIVTHPQSTSVAPGGNVSFNVGAVGGNPLLYQWRKNSNNIPNATNASYTIPSAAVGDAGFYQVVVSNAFGTATSSNAQLTVICSTPVSITSQPQDQTLVSGGTISLSVAVAGTAPYAFQWFRNGSPIANATNSTYVKITAQSPDSGLYQVVINNCIGVPAASSSVVVSVADAPFALMGLTNHVWKYNATGTDLGTAWREVVYDDSVWATGRGLLAWENQAVINPLTNTVLSLSNNITAVQLPTYYFRTTFVFTNDAALVSLVSSNYFDDGAVVYLNGTELFRFNMPEGVVGYNTLAPVANPLGEGVFIISNVPPGRLVQGTNVVAVEVHQNGLASSDIAFGMELRLSFPAPTLLAITNQPQNLTVFETKPATFSVGLQGQPAYFQWYKDGVAVPAGTSNPFTIPIATTNDAGFYYVVATNFVNSVTSSVVLLTVLPDTNSPVIIEADGSASVTNVLVSFSELIQMTNATNVLNYKITNTVSGAQLTISRAVLQNGTNVLLTTSARTSGQNYILVVNNLRDVSPRGNVIALNSSYPVRSLVPLLAMGGYWRFYDPFPPFDVADLGTAWKEFTYNEGANIWADGFGIFYNGQDETDVPGAIGSPLSQTDTITSYFRSGFGLQASPGGLRLLFTHVIDDGGVIYLNGAEVLRVNLPTGTVNYQTPATIAVDPVPRVGPLSVAIASLRQGSNVVAVELHQQVAIDVDKVFGLQIDAAVQSFVVGPVVVTGGPEDTTATEGQSATFRVIQAGGSTFQWQRYGTNLVGATNDTYTIPYVTTNIHLSTYRVTVSNPSGSVLTTNATLRVISDTNGPTVISAFARTNNTIFLTFSEALGTASAQTAANYTVTNGSGVVVPVTGAVLANGTNVTLSFGSTLAGRYTVVINNVTDAASVPNAIAPNTAVTVGADYFLAMTGPWKYLQVNTNATVQSTFMQTALDDSTWSGPSNALLYVEDAALPAAKSTLLTLLDGGGNRFNTYYFRQKFVAPVISASATLTLSHIIDDGMILYLNGSEIYRFNMPAGVPTAATQAAANTGNAVLVGPITVTLTNLVGGTNVFAVEVHQQGAESSDVVMGVELSLSAASVVIPSPQTVQLTCQPQSRTNAVGTTASFSVCAAGSAPIFYQWRKGGVNIPNATNNILLLNNVQLGDAATYSVLVTNASSSVLSSNAVLTVTNVVGPCTFISYTNSLRLTNSVTVSHPTTNSSTIILSWANPVTNSCGSNAVVVLQRAYTLGTGNPVPGTVWTNIFTNVFGQARVTNSVTNSSQVYYRLRVP